MLNCYKVIKEIKNQTKDDRASSKLKTSGGNGEVKLSVNRYEGSMNTDWLEVIKAGLPHIEAAIREDRQFIKQEGTIMPIEKVRRVQRASVEHLARHSELISKLPEDTEEIIPDKLSVYENLSNYTIYENRVLYMVLLFVRDFVELKMKEINQLYNMRKVCMNVDKTYKSGNSSVEFSMNIAVYDSEEDGNKLESKIEKDFEEVISEVYALLGTGLMKEAAYAPLVKPPITRTNILKMDVHFREVMELYDYLTKYQGDGVVNTDTVPCNVELSRNNLKRIDEDIAEVMMVSKYIASAYSDNKIDELGELYDADLRKQEQERIELRNRKLKDLKEKVNKSEEDIYEYISLLEEEKEEANKARISIEEKNKKLEAEHVSYVKQSENQIKVLQDSVATYKENEKVYRARILGMRSELKQINDDEKYSDRDSFLNLEEEYKAFNKFYKKTWKEAKKEIRKEHFWNKKG